MAIRFGVDAKGRPTQLRVVTSVPSGVFDHAAITALAKWRFSVTNAEGNRVVLLPAHEEFPHPISLEQTLVFVMSLPYVSGSNKTESLLDWFCGQPDGNTLVVTRAPATASRAIRIAPHKHAGVDRARLKVPPGTRLPNGWVEIGFCVSPQGSVTHAKVTASSPQGLYDSAALAALKGWPFEARKRDGTAQKTCGLKEHIRVLGADYLAHSPGVISRRPVALRKADMALQGKKLRASGKVTLGFCIEADGSITGAKVLSTTGPNLFDQAALKILHLWDYWPRMVNGKTMRTCHIRQTIAFRNLHTHSPLVWVRSASAQ